MSRSSNRCTWWGPSEGVAHALECALFGTYRMRTGHPVHRSARRCGVNNAKGVLEHGVPFPSQYPMLSERPLINATQKQLMMGNLILKHKPNIATCVGYQIG
jgi:hypothetical protein